MIYALTSYGPSRLDEQIKCTRSWEAAGLKVVAFQHPLEVEPLRKALPPSITFIPTTRTSFPQFKRHCVHINAMLDWLRGADAPGLLINSDIELRLSEAELDRIVTVGTNGLVYFVRYNHPNDIAKATKEPYGIDAFLLHGKHAKLFPPSFLSMGQPFWDYWVPTIFERAKLPIHAVEFPVTFHNRHRANWTSPDWHACGIEFNRMMKVVPSGTVRKTSYSDVANRIRLRLRKTVPQIPGNGAITPMEIVEPEPPVPTPSTSILIATYAADAKWLEYCLKSIRKYCSGFADVTAVYPTEHSAILAPICNCYGVLTRTVPGIDKGYLRQQVIKCHADVHCPDADYILHVDSDCVFHLPTTPATYFVEGKPLALRETYVRLGKTVPWQAPTAHALGFTPLYETMRRHPMIYPRELYGAFRKHVEALHGPFEQYILSRSTFSEFNAMGSYAMQFHEADYHWVTVDGSTKLPPEHLRQFWSRSDVKDHQEWLERTLVDETSEKTEQEGKRTGKKQQVQERQIWQQRKPWQHTRRY